MAMQLLSAAADQPAHEGPGGEHVVLLVDQFPRVLGGGERVVLRTAALLGNEGFRVSIVTFAVHCAETDLQSAGCPILVLPVSRVASIHGLRAAWQFGRFLRRQRVRYVMTFFESSNLYGGVIVKLLSRARLIWNRRDMGILRGPKHARAYRMLRWLPDYVVAVSDKVRQHAIEADGIAPHRAGVVYNGIAIKSTTAGEDGGTAPVIVTVGNVRPVKGHDILIEAAAEVLRSVPEATFLIAGDVLDAEYLDQMQRRIEALGIGKQVRFVGGVTDTAAFLRHGTIFVLPSRSEGFSNAVVEAMAAGLPIVATEVGGNAEAIVDGESGRIVPPGDASRLAQALLWCLSNETAARAMGEAARERALALFTTEAMVRRLREVFLLADRPYIATRERQTRKA